ncbi:MAG: thiamine pyrophosphate-binding protein [Bryobacteraceae bacterium]
MPSGAELFVNAISQAGIDRVFTLVGDHLNAVLVAAARAGLRVIDMRHESGVTHAADAWARITRRPAVALVTGGPGHTNALTGIATAYLAASPLVAVSGARASKLAARQAFQDIDQPGMVRPVVKWAGEPPNAAQIPFYVARALAEANAGRKGPVHLNVPVDIFEQEAPAPAALPRAMDAAPPHPDPRELERAAALLSEAARPVAIAGSGVWWGGAEQELRAFIERTGLPLYTITMARGAVPDDHPLVMGYADPSLNRAAAQAFREADVFLVIGKRIDFRLALGGARLFPPEAKFIQIDIHPQELGLNRTLECAVCGDVKAALAGIGRVRPPAAKWMERLRALRREWETRLAAAACDRGTPLHPAALYAELREALPPGTLYSWDGGDFAHWGRAMLPARHPGGWLRLGPLGTIGSALPNAIALKLAYPESPVALITGDGSLGFYLAELDTAVRHRLPFVIIVGNDGGWGLERELQSAALGGSTVGCELRETRYDLVMQALGGGGETVERVEEVRPAVERAFAAGAPYLINARIRGVRSPFTEWNLAGKAKAAR